MHREMRADRVRTGKPGLREGGRLAGPPRIEEACETAGQKRREGLGKNLPAKRAAYAIIQRRSPCEIDAEADSDALTAALKQDPGELVAPEHDVIRPFEFGHLARDCDVDCLQECETGDQ